MKTVRLTLHHTAETVHPMHRFVADSDAFDSYRMVHGSVSDDEEHAFIFHVVGDADSYESALTAFGGVTSYELTRLNEQAFSVYVRDAPDDIGTQLLDTFSQGSLVSLPPLAYRSDWSVRFSIVGESADLQQALADVPEGITAVVEEVGEYDGSDGAVAVLTTRQREALEVAREIGYFDVPRSAGVADVAAELGCAPGTAAEHLRKAEAAVVSELEL